ncbi:GntR family transcriptional regulator [Microbacterium sp. JZ31]|uniref:GntR family transcriptional regulator n=1 Tax=Microbacterium sp. JZ31 TaxID=1906274 RepID=UPI0019328724|nr:GntR family transcriptional regulator [Microbacterium sp. JZ31]
MAGSLTDRLTDDLRARILIGAFEPGSMIVEPRLAEEFGVSKTPVREALGRLASEGLVVVLPKKGYLVRPMALRDVEEVLTLRDLLEPHAAAEAAARITPDQLEDLRGMIRRQNDRAGAEPLEAVEDARVFHSAIAAASGNVRLAEAISRPLDETSRAHHILTGMRRFRTPKQEVEEHERIVEALASGSAEAAAEAMRAHLASIRAAVLGAIAAGERAG